MTEFTLDMTMMFAIHDALRRDLARVALMESRSEGWDFFERMLHLHHTAEDDLLWPVARDAVADRPDDVDSSTTWHRSTPSWARCSKPSTRR